MATTTNYSWTTPDDTDLVKDGAAAIRTLGSSVDTTVKNLNPETTLGDLAYRSSTANVKTRLALGTAGQVLTVNSGATAPEWATSASGGMTLLSTTTLSGAATTITGINQSYTDLRLVFSGVTNSTADGEFRLHFNSALTSVVQRSRHDGSTAFQMSSATYQWLTPGDASYRYLRTSADNISVVDIPLYSDSTVNHVYKCFEYYKRVGDIHYTQIVFGGMYGPAAISSVEIVNTGGNWAGGTCRIYGIK